MLIFFSSEYHECPALVVGAFQFMGGSIVHSEVSLHTAFFSGTPCNNHGLDGHGQFSLDSDLKSIKKMIFERSNRCLSLVCADCFHSILYLPSLNLSAQVAICWYFLSTQGTKKALTKPGEEPSLPVCFAGGASAGAGFWGVWYPLETIKTRMQARDMHLIKSISGDSHFPRTA